MKRLPTILLMLLSTSAVAGQVYVCPSSGDDAGPGNREKPFKTLQAAMDKMKPGDTCFIMPGLYEHERHLVLRGNAARLFPSLGTDYA